MDGESSGCSRTSGHEWACSATHAVAALASAAGMGALIMLAALRGNAWQIVSFSLYSATVVLLFCASALYHAARAPRVKRVLRVIDHASIFLLIAGTYTPFTLATPLRGPWGWSLFACVWGLAFAGLVLKILFTGRFKVLSTLLYLAMGWLIVVALKPLASAVGRVSFVLLAAGGLCYTLGVLFYAFGRLPFNHAIWHVFVLSGSACHFLAMFFLDAAG